MILGLSASVREVPPLEVNDEAGGLERVSRVNDPIILLDDERIERARLGGALEDLLEEWRLLVEKLSHGGARVGAHQQAAGHELTSPEKRTVERVQTLRVDYGSIGRGLRRLRRGVVLLDWRRGRRQRRSRARGLRLRKGGDDLVYGKPCEERTRGLLGRE